MDMTGAHPRAPPAAAQDAQASRYRRRGSRAAARCGAGGFTCGAEFSAADCVIGHNVAWARGYGLCRDDVFRAYLSRLSKRPAFAAAFADAHELDLGRR
jgi:glutathione S-transferase